MTDKHTVTYHGQWADITLAIDYTPNWLGLGYTAHLEIRAEEKLPVTETGYRSVFLDPETVALHGGAVAYVEGLLNEAAQQPQWQRYRQERKQLLLF